MKLIQFSIFIALFFLISSCQNNIQEANLIIINATIWTGNDEQITAQSMAITGDSIVAIGTNKETQVFQGSTTKVVDLKGRFITPGFIDSHVHLMTGGRSLLSVDLRDASTPEEFTHRIAEFTKSKKNNEWILEGNWDHTLWGGELPRKEWIDEQTPNNPVVVFRLDWHMVLANSAALKFAGINENTADVEGGEIIRDANGFPTGLLKDNAMNLLLDKIPPMSPTEKDAAFEAAMNYFLSNGVTSVHDVDGLNKGFESYTTALKYKEANNLDVRIYAANPLNEYQQLKTMNLTRDKWIKTGALKGFVDGSLGSHTAAFHHAYSDKADDKGFFINNHDDLYQWVSGADKSNLHVLVHAIGDSAVHVLLNIFERVIEENGNKDRRFRIEHAQHLVPQDIHRFAELGVLASMQPYHAIDDGRWAEEYIGPERIKTTYAFKSLLDAHATLAFGSDWAVAPASPLQGIYAATTRRTLDNKNPDGWIPEQKITAEQALIAYTKNAAYASFDEKIKGTLEVGKLADFVVLNQDILATESNKIKDIQVLETYVGGKRVFDLNGSR